MAIDDLHSGSTHHHYEFLRHPKDITQSGMVAMALLALLTFVFAAFVVFKILNDERAAHTKRLNPLPAFSEKSF